jgi:hypothetical protein
LRMLKVELLIDLQIGGLVVVGVACIV